MTRGEWLFQQIRNALADAIGDRKDELTDIAKAGGREAAGGIIGDVGRVTSILHDFLGGIPIIGGIIEDVVDPLKAIEDAGGKIGTGFGAGYLLGYAGFQLLQPAFRTLVQSSERIFHSLEVDPSTSAMLDSKRIPMEWSWEHEAEGSGIDIPKYRALREGAYSWLPLAELFELHRRKVIDDAELQTGLDRLGIPPDQIGHVRGLIRNLLSPADLALAFLRTEIDEGVLREYSHELGVTDADMNVLIGNTGEPLGLMELLEAYRREFIDKPRLERGIRQSRVRNEWIDVAERLRFSPMSTADAVRSVVENYLTSDEGKRIAEQNGLEPQHWDTLVKSWGRPLAHEQMASLVHRGLASRAQFDQAMRESDLKNKYIPASFEVAERLLPERLIVTAIRYQAIDLKVGARMLLQLGYSKESAGILLKLGLHEQHGTAHELTRAQITTLYTDGILHRDDALKHLEALGYPKQDADYMLQIVDVQQHAKEVRAEVSVIRSNYLAGAIDAVQAEIELRQVGQTTAQAQHSIEVWNREKRRAARGLSESQIVKAAKAQTIKLDEAMRLLTAIGYSHADATVLLASNGVTVR